MNDKTKGPLTREALINGDIERLLHSNRQLKRIMNDEQRHELIQSTLGELGETDELWVFGYGSLIWNPALEYEEQKCCQIQDFHRRFCFWTTLSRGTVEHPGLMMGLVEGGQCEGVAFRIAREKAETELNLLFRREMSSYIYKPTWVEASCKNENRELNCLTFVVDQSHERFDGSLTDERIIETLATAVGPLGRNCDYLFELCRSLEQLDISETAMDQLAEKVKAFQSR